MLSAIETSQKTYMLLSQAAAVLTLLPRVWTLTVTEHRGVF